MTKDLSLKKYKLIEKIMSIEEEHLLDKIEKELSVNGQKKEKINLKKFADKILSEDKALLKRLS